MLTTLVLLPFAILGAAFTYALLARVGGIAVLLGALLGALVGWCAL